MPQEENNPEKFQNTYRVLSARLKNYDYGKNGAYFITICTRNREHFFGNIRNGKMQFSEMGEIVAQEWERSAKIRNNIILGEWIVMPNHFHGILMINNDGDVETPRRGVCTGNHNGVCTGNHNGVCTGNHKPQWKPGCLGAIVNQFKSKCTKRIWKFAPHFSWHPRFYDRVIRNEDELNRISEYIISNPEKWEYDDYFS